MLTGRLLLALLPLVLAPGLRPAPAPASPQEARQQRRLERAERRFQRALERRDRAYEALLAAYQAAEAWFQGQVPADEAPDFLAAWLEEREFPREAWEEQRQELAAAGPFHAWWNEELYRACPAAAEYARAMGELEEAFLARERLRHPERFTRAAREVPEGMALIPGGRYVLGPATGYILGFPDWQKPREVRIRPFYLDKREVSCADWARFLQALPRDLREDLLPPDWSLAEDGTPVFPPGHATVPVTGIPWTAAARYARWAGKRLPTEEEWEAAARGLEGRPWPHGATFDPRRVNCREHGAGAPLPPAALTGDATPQGVLCLGGNVREWTADLYEEHPERNRALQVRRAGPTTQAVVRGGSFQDPPEACASSFRWLEPALTGLPYVGFRCALDAR